MFRAALLLAFATMTFAPSSLAAPAAAATDTAAQTTAALSSADAMTSTAQILRDVRAGVPVPKRAAVTTLARAAEAMADAGDLKGAAVAADAAWVLGGRPHAPRTALLVLRYATAIADEDPAGARALAERALAQDPSNTTAQAWANALAGNNTSVVGHSTLGAGVGLLALAATGFVVGNGIERTLEGSVHDTATVDALLTQRTALGVAAWSTLALGGAATVTGVGLLWMNEPGVDAVLPAAFLDAVPATKTSTNATTTDATTNATTSTNATSTTGGAP